MALAMAFTDTLVEKRYRCWWWHDGQVGSSAFGGLDSKTCGLTTCHGDDAVAQRGSADVPAFV